MIFAKKLYFEEKISRMVSLTQYLLTFPLMKSEFKQAYYQIADAIESMRDLPLDNNFTAILLEMRMKLEEAGKIVQKDLGNWD